MPASLIWSLKVRAPRWGASASPMGPNLAARGHLAIDRLLQRARTLRSELRRGQETGAIEGAHFLAQDRLEQGGGVEIERDADVAGEGRQEVLLQIEPRQLL